MTRLLTAIASLGCGILAACHDNAPTTPNALPTIDSIAPGFVQVQGGAQTLTVFGTGFVPASRARWRDADRTTVYIDATHLAVQLFESDAAVRGPVPLAIYNPPPGGGTSANLAVIVGFPQPVLTELRPSSVAAGSGAVTVSVRGSGFVPQSIVRSTQNQVFQSTFIAPGELDVHISPLTVEQPGVRSLTVVNPDRPPTAAVDFSVNYPLPALTRLSPDTIAVDVGTVLTILGHQFYPPTQILFDGQPHATTFVDSTQLKTTLTSADFAVLGTRSVTVSSPAPGGGATSARPLVIRAAALRIVKVLPSLLSVGAGATTVVMTGFGFSAASAVRANGTALLPTVFAGPDTLRVTVPAVQLTTPGPITLTVTDPASSAPSPGYVVSVAPTTPSFVERVVDRLNNDIVYDARRDLIYASANAQSPADARLFAIDPNTATVVWDVPVSHVLNGLAISSDGSHLFASAVDAVGVVRFDIDQRVEDAFFELRDETGTLFPAPPNSVSQIIAVTGMPDAFAVTSAGRLFLFQDGVCRASAPALIAEPGSDPGELLAWVTGGTNNGLIRYRISEGRFDDDQRRGDLSPETPAGPQISAAGGVVFGGGGAGVDARTLARIGVAPAGGFPAVDGVNLRVHFFLNLAVRSFHARSLEPAGVMLLTRATGNERRMIIWGRNGLALRRPNGILLVSGSAVAP